MTRLLAERFGVAEIVATEVDRIQHDIAPELYQRIKKAFLAHMTPYGTHFLKPHRVDILRRSGA